MYVKLLESVMLNLSSLEVEKNQDRENQFLIIYITTFALLDLLVKSVLRD